jgi:hypothetical protein
MATWNLWNENVVGPCDITKYMALALVVLSGIFRPGCGFYGLKGKRVPCLAN